MCPSQNLNQLTHWPSPACWARPGGYILFANLAARYRQYDYKLPVSTNGYRCGQFPA